MTNETRKQLDVALSDIQRYITLINEITCERFIATVEFIGSCLPDLDPETRLNTNRLMTMYGFLHNAKHKCQEIAHASGEQCYLVVQSELIHAELVKDITRS